MIGSMTRDLQMYIEKNNLIPIHEKRINQIFFQHFYDEKDDNNMVVFSRDNGMIIAQDITKDFMKLFFPKSEDEQRPLIEKVYKDIFFMNLTFIWRCLPDLQENDSDKKKKQV